MDGKVNQLYHPVILSRDILQKPELATMEAHITQATRKVNNAEKLKEGVVRDLKSWQERFDRLPNSRVCIEMPTMFKVCGRPFSFYVSS